MRRTYTSPFTGVTSIVYMNLAELEYEKLVEEIDNEKFEMEQRRQQEKTYPPGGPRILVRDGELYRRCDKTYI